MAPVDASGDGLSVTFQAMSLKHDPEFSAATADFICDSSALTKTDLVPCLELDSAHCKSGLLRECSVNKLYYILYYYFKSIPKHFHIKQMFATLIPAIMQAV